MQPAPLINDPLSEVSGNARKLVTNGSKSDKRTAQDDYLDSLMGPDAMSEDEGEDGFIEDDDGAGYAEEPNRFGKRAANGSHAPQPKRQASRDTWQPRLHESFQPEIGRAHV